MFDIEDYKTALSTMNYNMKTQYPIIVNHFLLTHPGNNRRLHSAEKRNQGNI